MHSLTKKTVFPFFLLWFYTLALGVVYSESLSSNTNPSQISQEGTAANTTETQAEKDEKIAETRDQPSEDVNDALQGINQPKAGLLPFGPISLIHPHWLELKKKTLNTLGLDLGLAYTILYQYTPDNAFGPGHGAVGDFDFFGKLTLPGKRTSGWEPWGIFTELRDSFTVITPNQLNDSIGSLWNTTQGFSRQDFSLTQVWWEEKIWDDILVFTVGKIDIENYFNSNRIAASANRYFLNQGFSSNPANALPSNGLGARLKLTFLKSFYLSGGFADMNGKKTSMDLTTITEGEFYTVGELGIIPNFEKIGPGTYRVTFWHADERFKEETPDAWGWAFSFDQQVYDNLILFFRYGYASDWVRPTEHIIAVGGGWQGVGPQKNDFLGLAFSWGRPSKDPNDPNDDYLRDQYIFETFYRHFLTSVLTLTPNLQFVINPSDNTFDSFVPIFGIRGRMTF